VDFDSGQDKKTHTPLQSSAASTAQEAKHHYTATRSAIKSKSSSRHHADLGEQSGVPNPVEVRLAKSGRRQDTATHLVRRGLIACDSDSSFGEQHAGQSVHAAVVSHASHHALRVARVGDVGVSNGPPFYELLAGFPGSLSVYASGKLNDSNTHSLLGPSPG
jgi:hypothetical protein